MSAGASLVLCVCVCVCVCVCACGASEDTEHTQLRVFCAAASYVLLWWTE